MLYSPETRNPAMSTWNTAHSVNMHTSLLDSFIMTASVVNSFREHSVGSLCIGGSEGTSVNAEVLRDPRN